MCIIYTTIEAQEFSKKFNEAMDTNAELLGTVEALAADESDAAADELAASVEKVAVSDDA